MRKIILIISVLIGNHLHAQELFTWSEPASNMAAKGIGLRLNNSFMDQEASDKYNYQLQPEIMWGISPKLMVHLEGFMSNNNTCFSVDGGSLYAKYRFLSQDEVHSHFRMALFARGVINDSHIHQPAIDFNSQNSGYEAGLIATKLVNKIAISAGSSILHATDNLRDNKIYYDDKYRNAVGFNLSLGKLMLPKEYVSYNQVNLNLMVEMLGQTNLGNGESYIDIAPVIQFIIQSKIRIDGSYRFAVVRSLERSSVRQFLLRFEYNIFNAYK